MSEIRSSATLVALRDLERSSRRATMFIVREAGRVVKNEAKRNVRVYHGRPRFDVPRGRLRKSIHSDKRLRRSGEDTYSVRVAPRGWPVRGYAPKIEALDGYMEAGRRLALEQIDAIAEKSWARATRRRV